MTEMAAEVADGILGHPVWSPRWIAGEVRAAVDRGLARAGRERGDLRITAWLRVAITDDIEQGRDDARVGIPFYASLRQYDSYFDALGLATDARRLQDLAEAGAPAAEQSAAVSDAMADELVVIGPARRRGGAHRGGARRRRRRCASRRPTGCRRIAPVRTTTAIATHLLPGGASR